MSAFTAVLLAAGVDPEQCEFARPMAVDEVLVVLTQWEAVRAVCERAKAAGAVLVSLFAADERALEDHAFKVYCVLSHPDGELVTLEHRLPEADEAGRTRWRSIRDIFPAAEPLERELADLFGLAVEPELSKRPERPVLIGDYGAKDFPLLRDWDPRPGPHLGEPRARAEKSRESQTAADRGEEQRDDWPPGLMLLPVGPIHAGVIQPGYFAFHVAGETVEHLPVQLGFTHRGIEKLFERRALMDGWQLAEVAAGDSAVTHALAYCRAVESLAGFAFAPAHPVSLWRGLLLELERIINHMADCAAIVHDMAFDAPASRLAMVQERTVRLGEALTGHRLLRGVNRPGAVVFEGPGRTCDALADVGARVRGLVHEFLGLALPVMYMPECRDRLIATGVLTRDEALNLGACGLPARASRVARDFRVRHPWGCYELKGVRKALAQTYGAKTGRRVPVRVKAGDHPDAVDDRTGDVFARTWLRLAEMETSVRIIGCAVVGLRKVGEPQRLRRLAESGGTQAQGPDPEFLERLREAPNRDFGLGCVEGWRGEVSYWLMKGPRGGIYRCKVRDPSVFNWPALAAAVVRKRRRAGEPGKGEFHMNILADFPLINKSFNLSYSGTDL